MRIIDNNMGWLSSNNSWCQAWAVCWMCHSPSCELHFCSCLVHYPTPRYQLQWGYYPMWSSCLHIHLHTSGLHCLQELCRAAAFETWLVLSVGGTSGQLMVHIMNHALAHTQCTITCQFISLSINGSIVTRVLQHWCLCCSDGYRVMLQHKWKPSHQSASALVLVLWRRKQGDAFKDRKDLKAF